MMQGPEDDPTTARAADRPPVTSGPDRAIADPSPSTRQRGGGTAGSTLDQADAGAEPDPDRLDTAIRHLEIAVLDGMDGVMPRPRAAFHCWVSC